MLLALSKHPCSGCCSACRRRWCICSLVHFQGVWLQGLVQGACTGWDCSVHQLQGSTLQAQGAWIAQTCRKCFLEAIWVKSRASPATHHQCKKVSCISTAPSFMYYKVVLRRAHWDPGVTYSKSLLCTVCKWWEWRTGRHSWKKLYQGALTGNMDYSTGCRSERQNGYLLGQLKSVEQGSESKASLGMFSFTPSPPINLLILA